MAEDLDREPEEQFVSLYRRFRPGRFAELRGQPHVVRALQGAVRDGRVAHAYLFSGPRGTGKTSTARILARALNCQRPVDGEPCGECPSCVDIARGSSFDVHELDAASNNGVDAMRDLIAHAALATPGRWKVYIVDEVHMLSNAAANALLKTLEEPPAHVVFVLATTDPQKVPPTIRSRTQHLEFGLIGAGTLDELLHDVSTRAGLALDDDSIAVAVRRGRGSARDALSALDQVVASGSAEALRPDVAALTGAIADDDAHRALVAVAVLHDAGWGAQQVATELVDDLRQAFLSSLAPELCDASGTDRDRLADQAGRLGLARVVRAIETIGRAQVDMRDAPDPRAVLEVGIVRLARPELDDSTAALAERISRLEQALTGRSGVQPPAPSPDPAPAAGQVAPAPSPGPLDARKGLGALRRERAGAQTSAPPAPTAPSQGADPVVPQPPRVGPPPSPPGHADPPDRDRVVEAWGDHILRGLPARAKALYSAGRFVAMEGATATFALPNAAHRERCEDVRGLVEQAIGAHFATRVRLVLTVEDGGAEPSSDMGLHPDDEIDPDQPAGSAEAVARARLLEAFPGAEEVSG